MTFKRKSLPSKPGDLSHPLQKVIITSTDPITGEETVQEIGGVVPEKSIL